jgi:hypothetical protein
MSKQRKQMIILFFLLLLLGWGVKEYRRTHPTVEVSQPSGIRKL